MRDTLSKKWPKVLEPLSPEQARVNDEFMKLWHEVLPRRFGRVDRFNHGFPASRSVPGFTSTLEIGAGLGEHLNHESLTPEQERHYYALEFRENMAAQIRARHPHVNTIVGDCQRRLDFPDGSLDRILAIHVLEHLPDLPACIRECHRLLNPTRGQMLVVIPTEGSLAYGLARKLSAERVYRRHFGGDYSWIPRREHINRPNEILEELQCCFDVKSRRFFPLPWLPFTFCNLCLGLDLTPRFGCHND